MKLKIFIIAIIIFIVVFYFLAKKSKNTMATKKCTLKHKFSNVSSARLNKVNATLVAIMKEAVKCSPFDFGIAWLGGFRTAQEQSALFQKNTPSKWVTSKDGYIKKSKHQYGKAIDIVCYNENGIITWEPSCFKKVAAHILEIAKNQFNIILIWGGDWTKKDYGHFEIR